MPSKEGLKNEVNQNVYLKNNERKDKMYTEPGVKWAVEFTGLRELE